MNPPLRIFSLTLVLLAALPGCGTKTELVRPPGPPVPPPLGVQTAPKPAAQAAASSSDDSNKPAAVLS